MNIDTALQLYIMAGDQLDALWEFFLTVHLAIAAAIYGIDKLRRLHTSEYILLFLPYAAFSLINVRTKQQAYEFLIALEKDLESSLATSEHSSHYTNILIFFNGVEFSDRIIIIWLIHIGAVFLIIWLSFSKRIMHTKL